MSDDAAAQRRSRSRPRRSAVAAPFKKAPAPPPPPPTPPVPLAPTESKNTSKVVVPPREGRAPAAVLRDPLVRPQQLQQQRIPDDRALAQAVGTSGPPSSSPVEPGVVPGDGESAAEFWAIERPRIDAETAAFFDTVAEGLRRLRTSTRDFVHRPLADGEDVRRLYAGEEGLATALVQTLYLAEDMAAGLSDILRGGEYDNPPYNPAV